MPRTARLPATARPAPSASAELEAGCANSTAASDREALNQRVAQLQSELDAANNTAASDREALNQRVAQLQSELDAANNTAASDREASAQRVTELEEKLDAANSTAASDREARHTVRLPPRISVGGGLSENLGSTWRERKQDGYRRSRC
jgi:DNA repair exonuclease SbcCD ATPase subunit